MQITIEFKKICYFSKSGAVLLSKRELVERVFRNVGGDRQTK